MKKTIVLLLSLAILGAGLLLPASAVGADSEWIPKERGGIEYYEDENGISSTIITENEVVWLYEQSYDAGCWYGLDNRSGIFEPGSRLCVRWLTKEEDPEEWNAYLETQSPSERERLQLLQTPAVLSVGVTLPDGSETTPEQSGVPFYVELGDDWDLDDIAARFISENEGRSKLSIKTVRLDGENRRFAELTYESPKILETPPITGVKAAPNTTPTADPKLWTVLILAELFVLVPMVILAIVLFLKLREVQALLNK